MGEAKRRKKLDPNYGKSPMMGWRTELEWKKKLGVPEKHWAQAKSDLRIINSLNDVDESIDAVWIYKDKKGNEIIKPTGGFASDGKDKEFNFNEKGKITIKKSKDKNLNYRYRIDYKAKVTTMSDEIYEDECWLETALDLGIEDEMDTLNVDEGMIYGEAFKKAMNAFFDSYIHKETSEMLKEATITLKKVEIIPREATS